MIILKTGPGKPLITAEAFKWQRPCNTIPFTYKIKIQREQCEHTRILSTNKYVAQDDSADYIHSFKGIL